MCARVTIDTDKAVAIHYSLTLDNGEKIDSSEGRDPLFYLHGHGNIVLGLESALNGKSAGEKLDVTVSAEDGYGVHQPEGLQEVPRDAFPSDVELTAGMQLGTEDEDGNVTPVWIKAVTEEHVAVDFNHPLAGQTLNFAVEIVEVRDATAEELEHGHVHAPGGHEH